MFFFTERDFLRIFSFVTHDAPSLTLLYCIPFGRVSVWDVNTEKCKYKELSYHLFGLGGPGENLGRFE